MSHKKVCFFTHYSNMNGANQSLLTLIKYIKDKVEIERVFVPLDQDKDAGLPEELTKMGVPVERVKLRPFLYFTNTRSFFGCLFHFILNISSWVKMYRSLKNKDIDWIYSNSSIENSGIVMAKLLGIKHLWHVREFGYADYNYKHIGGDTTKRKILGFSNRIVAISESIYDYIDLREKTSLIYNGIFYLGELDDLNKKEDLPTTVNLGMVGVVDTAKNQKRAVILLKNLGKEEIKGQIKLNLYGNVPNENYSNQLKQIMVAGHLNDHVTFHGFVNDKNKIYENIDVLLMCSPSEAFGRVTIEAMAFGIPVIGFDNAGTAELIDDGVNGFLYDDQNTSLEECLTTLIQNEELYKEISKGARNTAERYSVERYGTSILKLINDDCDSSE